MDEQYYIFRGDRSGVFFGKMGKREGREVEILEARNLWHWSGANSLSDIAANGVTTPSACRFTITVSSIILLDCIEIIPCTEDATECIKGVKVWRS